MTLIVLTVLGAAWLGYFALWYREKRAARPLPNGGMLSFSGSPAAVGRQVVPFGSVAEGGKPLGDLLEPPRTKHQALRRRRQVAAALAVVAVASLLAAPVLGPSALTVHVLADVVLLLFAMGSMQRQQPPAMTLSEVRVLYPDRPAVDTVAMPLERVATG